MVNNRNEPYFAGQKPSECGHYFPDVLRIRDEIIGESAERTLHCAFCGEYRIPIKPSMTSKESLPEKDIPETRKREFEKIRLLR